VILDRCDQRAERSRQRRGLAAESDTSNLPSASLPESARRKAISFAKSFTIKGTVEVAAFGAGSSLIAGQVVEIAVRTPADTREVELIANGIVLAQSSEYPFVFTFNVPDETGDLRLTPVAHGDTDSSIAHWRQPIEGDGGTTLQDES